MIYLHNIGASGGDRLYLVQISLFSRVEETLVTLERTKSVRKERPSSTLFTYED
jgi:hypothetical protein